jgi:hypothetical protein
MPDIEIAWLRGQCPKQAEGWVVDERGNSHKFYFRSRGMGWTLDLPDRKGREVASVGALCGPWPSAGWITDEEARKCIEASAPLLLVLLKMPNLRKGLKHGDGLSKWQKHNKVLTEKYARLYDLRARCAELALEVKKLRAKLACRGAPRRR